RAPGQAVLPEEVSKDARMLHGDMLKDKNVHKRPLCFAAPASWAISLGGICLARARTPRAYRGESNATRFRHAQAAHWEFRATISHHRRWSARGRVRPTDKA